MADDLQLLSVSPNSPLVRKLDPQVVSLAVPDPEYLVQARVEVNRHNSELRQFFVEAKEGKGSDWAVQNVAVRLNGIWGGDKYEESVSSAQFLWDEFDQLGPGIYMVSTETGKIVASLSEEDLWQPEAVPREGQTTLSTPMKMVRPDLQGRVISWQHDKGREQRTLEALALRGHQTALLAEDGDPRLLMATKSGRAQIVDQVRSFEPETLLRMAGGTSGSFLRYFDLSDEPPANTEGLECLKGTVTTRSVMGVQDALTLNLHHSRAASLRGAMVQGWVRAIAKTLSNAAHVWSMQLDNLSAEGEPWGRTAKVSEITATDLRDLLWVCPPETVKALLKADPQTTLLPVEEAKLIGLGRHVGTIVVPKEFAAHSLERFDRWEAISALSYTLWVDMKALEILHLSGVEHQAFLV